MSVERMRTLGWLTFVLVATHPIAARDQTPAISPDTTVVILSGLPGDAESEAESARHLGSLLEVLRRPAVAPEEVAIFTDGGEADVPEGSRTTVARSRRETVLEHAARLSPTGGPVAVFVWGHGGMQGDSPVFHVRGPRITPEDLASFASALGDRPSTWFLSFRGSGRFASELQSSTRSVLSSDDGTMFGSAPRMMEILLSRLRADPTQSFTALAAETRSAVANWYEEQGLARTEDPTPWGVEEEAVEVASEPTGASPTPPTREIADLATEPTTPEGKGGLAAEESRPEVDPPASAAGWAEIDPVSAAEYPDAKAVVLRRTLVYELGESPAFVHEVDEFVQILAAEGTHHGDVDVGYSPPGEKITFLDCEVRRPDGRIIRLDPSDIREASPPPLEGYARQSRKIFSLPEVDVGVILRVHYRVEQPRFPLPYFPLTIPLADGVPLRALNLSVRVPKRLPLHYAVVGDGSPGGAEPEVQETAYARRYRWRFADRPAMASEPLSPPDAMPMLLMSTAESWQEFSAWYRRLIRLANTPTPEIERVARELTAGASDDRERVAKIYSFVAGLRYVAVPLGVNSHRPHAAQNVLEHRYGDCKDKANLFNTMLATVGIAADLVLVPRFAEARDAVPAAGFNHAISRVQLGDETLWVDTTDDVARFGLLPPGDPGRNVLVIADGPARLQPLPTPDLADHALSIRTEIEIPRDPVDPATTELRVAADGYGDYSLRAAARARSGTARPVLSLAWRPLAGVFAMTAQSSTPPSDLERSFEWTGAGSWSGLVSPSTSTGLAGGPSRWVVRAPFWLPAEWEQALHSRRNRLFLSSGYPLRLSQRLELRLPEGAARLAVPPALEEASGPLRWRIAWRADGESGTAVAELELEMPRGDLPHDQTAGLQRSLRSLYAALGAGAEYTLDLRGSDS